MQKIPYYICGVIPPHMQKHLAGRKAGPGADARATIERMREIATARARTLVRSHHAVSPAAARPRKCRRVYDAEHDVELPGRLVRTEKQRRSRDVEVNEAYDGCGRTHDFYFSVYGRNSIDDRGMRLDSTVHYDIGFSNAVWTGEQMVYGDGDGEIFNRFTASLEVIGHEWTHAVTQFTAALDYAGQTGALNEHFSDVFGSLVKQWTHGLSVRRSDWLIGRELFGPNVNARGVRSMAAPGTAYDDPLLGRDPQPAHMRHYVVTDEDNGGVHINSGILNYAFYRAAMAIGGYAWKELGWVWYRTLKDRLDPDADFHDFARATTDMAGELFGHGGRIQRSVIAAWSEVGLDVPLPDRRVFHGSPGRRRRVDASPLARRRLRA